MQTTLSIIIGSLLLLSLLIAGIILHRIGKPYHSLLFAAHKILTVLLIVLISTVVIKFLKLENTSVISFYVTGTMILAVMGLLFSGGMMSLDKFQGPMLIIHRLATWLFLVGYFFFIYLIINTVY